MKRNPTKQRPRELMLFRKIPENYYEHHQLAGSLQSLEAALLCLVFRQYNQSLVTIVSALERGMKAAINSKREDSFWKMFGLIGERYPSIGINKEQMEKLRELRNDIEHSGSSPSYDLDAGTEILVNGWDSCRQIFKHCHNFDVDEGLMIEIREALDLSRKTLVASRDLATDGVSYPYFLEPLVCQLRWRTRPTFTALSDEFNWDADYELKRAWRHRLETSDHSKDWDTVVCPICGDLDAMLSAYAVEEPELGAIYFERFLCPECGLNLHDSDTEPGLAETLLSKTIDGMAGNLLRGYGVNRSSHEIRWASRPSRGRQ